MMIQGRLTRVIGPGKPRPGAAAATEWQLANYLR